MASIIDFNENPPRYLKSVNTPDYLTETPDNKSGASQFAKPGVLINPDISSVKGVPRKYWKRDGDSVVEMTDSEKKSIDSQEKNKIAERINNYEFQGGELAKSLVDAGVVTKKQIVDFIKSERGIV